MSNSPDEQNERPDDRSDDGGGWHAPGASQPPQPEQQGPPPGYGPPPGHQPPPGYGPPPGHQPPPGYAQPPPGYGPPQGYAQPPPGYGPPQGYPQPPPGYGLPPPGYAYPYAPRPKVKFTESPNFFGIGIGLGILIGFAAAGLTLFSMLIEPTGRHWLFLIIAIGPVVAAIVSLFFRIPRPFAVGALIALAGSWLILLGPCLAMFSSY